MAPVPPSLNFTPEDVGIIVPWFPATTESPPDWPTIATRPSTQNGSERVDAITVKLGSSPDEETPTDIFETSGNPGLDT
jgi:hypothetical protein